MDRAARGGVETGTIVVIKRFIAWICRDMDQGHPEEITLTYMFSGNILGRSGCFCADLRSTRYSLLLPRHTMAQLLELLPHSARNPKLNLPRVLSMCSFRVFPLTMSTSSKCSCFIRHPNDAQSYGLIDVCKLPTVQRVDEKVV